MNIRKKILVSLFNPKTFFNYLKKDYFKKEKYYKFEFPVQITFFITERCNLNCPMCHVSESRRKFLEKSNQIDLDVELVKKALDEAKDFGSTIQLVGGEPLLYPNIFEVIKHANKNRLVTSITTNGTILKAKAKEIIDSKLKFLAVSLDSGLPKTHNKVRGADNVFDQALSGIKEIKKQRGWKNFPNIHLRTVISRESLDDFDTVYNIGAAQGIDEWSVSQFFYYPEGLKRKNDIFADKFKSGKDIWGMPIEQQNYFEKEQIEKLKSKTIGLEKMQKKAKFQVNVQDPGDLQKYYEGVPLSDKSYCDSPFWQIFIRQNGDIELCQGIIIGNVKEGTIKQAWESKKAKRFRELIKNKHITPACFRCCAMCKFKF